MANVTHYNKTDITVTFGTYNGVTRTEFGGREVPPHSLSPSSSGSSRTGVFTTAAWIDANNMYPNNENPYITSFKYAGSDSPVYYTVVLTKNEITVVESTKNPRGS